MKTMEEKVKKYLEDEYVPEGYDGEIIWDTNYDDHYFALQDHRINGHEDWEFVIGQADPEGIVDTWHLILAPNGDYDSDDYAMFFEYGDKEFLKELKKQLEKIKEYIWLEIDVEDEFDKLYEWYFKNEKVRVIEQIHPQHMYNDTVEWVKGGKNIFLEEFKDEMDDEIEGLIWKMNKFNREEMSFEELVKIKEWLIGVNKKRA